MIVTPVQLARRAEFYHQLSQFTGTGIGLIHALEQIKTNPPARSFREPIGRILDELAKGSPVAESLRRVGWLPDFDMALVEAGELSGRLDTSFRVLANYYNERARMARQVLSDLAYPAFLFHFAALMFLIILPYAHSQFNASLLWLCAKAVLTLLPFYIAGAVIIYANQSKHGEKWRAFMERTLNFVPLLGSGRRSLALSRLAMALEALINAGVNIIGAWELAATASGSPALKKAVTAWKSQVVAGQTPAEVVRASHFFPEMFSNLYQTGEVSGKLDDSLRQIHIVYQDDGARKLHAFAQWTPRLIYMSAVILIGYEVIKFYTGYFNNISNIMNGF